ncbi:zinc-dependent alcohol dehydrogenase [Alicyclobacillus dauci]|uniref:Alcohol dehydrogenase catalytic domain-containing protein n=1 Tax=Alicyclobacillus dauci TaxID=1475485 RepID=A0ABY6YXZ2_9BACL|nr:alcohol dehydrogenase catalytic domain-containing protein [Alicyclobacillus dauci]WAH35289.1 alcohol dehydrogenase catalytic domain-containing protein [Alicyclobacillus dauci]
MSEKSQSAVAIGVLETEIRELELPRIAPDAGILRVEIVGVCGTDVSHYRNFSAPMILGHHVVGYVDRIGEVASQRWGIKEGDRIAMEEYIPCGQCDLCRTGYYRLCSETDPRTGIRYGATPIDVSPSLFGGFSQYMYLHPNAVVHKIPNHVPAVEAALILPVSNGFEWMSTVAGVGPGQVVVIQGPGQQGLACALAAKAAGAETVIVTGRTSSIRRLELAGRLGADYTVNVSSEDLVERVAEITGGRMADVVLDVTSGGTEPVVSSLQVAKKRGVVLLGALKKKLFQDLDLDVIYEKSLTVKGVRGHSYHSVKMAIDFVASGKFPLRVMNSHDYGLCDTDLALRTAGGQGEPNPLLVTVSPWK